MAKLQWFKMYSEAYRDKRLSKLNDSEFRIWFNLLCLSSEQENRGEIENYDSFVLSIEVSNGEEEELENALDKLQKFRLVEIKDNTISFPSFVKRQYDNPSDRPEEVNERVKRHRNKKTKRVKEDCNDNETSCNDNETTTKRVVTSETSREEKSREEENRLEENREENKSTAKSPVSATPPLQETSNSEVVKSEKITSCSSEPNQQELFNLKSTGAKKQKSKIPYKEIVDMFNSLCVSLPSVRDITPKRKTAIEKSWNFSEERQNLEFYEELFKICEGSDFITGRKTEWRAFFDWIFNLTNMQKILENTYKNSNNNGKTKDKVLENNKSEYERFLEMNNVEKEESSIDLSGGETIDTEFFKVMEEMNNG